MHILLPVTDKCESVEGETKVCGHNGNTSPMHLDYKPYQTTYLESTIILSNGTGRSEQTDPK